MLFIIQCLFSWTVCCGCQECAKRIAKVSAEAKLEVDEETYLDKFRPHLMDVVYTWANGSTFAQICKMTDVFEGNNPTDTCRPNTCTELRNG